MPLARGTIREEGERENKIGEKDGEEGLKIKRRNKLQKLRENRKIRHLTFKGSLLSHLKFIWNRRTFLLCDPQSIELYTPEY